MSCVKDQQFILVCHEVWGWGVRDRNVPRTAFWGLDPDICREEAEYALDLMRSERDCVEDYGWDYDEYLPIGQWTYGMEGST